MPFDDYKLNGRKKSREPETHINFLSKYFPLILNGLLCCHIKEFKREIFQLILILF